MPSVTPGAGQLRQRVQVLTKVETADALGQVTTAWNPVGTYWAQVSFVKGAKLTYNGQIVDQVTHTVTLRYCGPLSPDQRLSYNGAQYTIVSIDNVNQLNLWYVIQCQELVGITLS
jgi:SPP1 family predicted phage head-tail adaptor